MEYKTARAIGLVILLVTSLLATGAAGAVSDSGQQSEVNTTGTTNPTLRSTSTVNDTSTITVSGTVSNHTGSPVSGIQVGYHNETFYESNHTTNGTYTLSLPSNDTYQVELRQTGGTTPFADDGIPGAYAYGFVDVSGDTTKDIHLPKGHDLTVKVVNQSGTAIQNATVFVHHTPGDSSTGVNGQTNAEGRFVPDQATDPGIEVTGSVRISANAPGYAWNDTQATVTNATTITLTLQETAPITGTIQGADGQAAAADKVEFSSQDGGNTTWTNSTGAFSTAVAKGNTYNAEFVQTANKSEPTPSFPQDGIPDLYALGAVDAGTNMGLVKLPEPSNLTVHVVGPDGNRLSGVPVNLVHRSKSGNAYTRATTNATGTISIEGVGDLHISANSDQYGIGSASTEVTLNGDKEITLKLPSVVTASGDLSSSTGVSLSGYQVYFTDGYDASASIGSNGSFETTVKVNNDYNVAFIQRDHQSERFYPEDGVPDFYAIQPLSVGTANVSVGATELPSAHHLNVTVVNQSGARLSDVPVYLRHTRNGASAFVSGTTNTNGQLVLDRASKVGIEANGTLEIDVEPNGANLPYLNTERTVNVTNDTNIRITVDPAVNLSGSITYADGSSPTGYTMHAWGENFGDSSTIQSTGNYSLSVAPNNQYDLIFKQYTWTDNKVRFPKDNRPDLYAVGSVDVGSSSVSVGETSLPVAHQLNVTVVNESGVPLSGLRVDVSALNGEVGAHHDATTNQDGEVILQGASTAGIEVTGEVRVSVHPPADSSLGEVTKTFTVDADRNETITLPDRVPVTGQVKYADGTNVSGYITELFGDGGSYDITAENGTFRLLGAPNQTYRLGFKQTDFAGQGQVDFPKDGRPDLHAFGPVSVGTEPVNLGTKQLPKAHTVNITVVNESGATLSGLEVDVTAQARYAAIHSPATTNANGMVVLEGAASPGIEANGTLRVTVGSTNKYIRTSKKIQVNRSRNVTITVNEVAYIKGRYLDANGDPLNNSFANAVIPYERLFPDGPVNETGYFKLPVEVNNSYHVGFLQRDGSGNFGPHDGVVDLYRTTAVTVNESNITIGTHTIPNATGLVNIRVVNESGVPVEGASVGVFPKNGDTQTYAVGWAEYTGPKGYYIGGEKRGVELKGSTAIRVQPPTDSEQFVKEPIWRNITVTGDRTVTIELAERPDKYNVTGTWEYPNGSAVSDVRWVINNFDGYSAGGQTDASGSFTAQIPSDTNQTFYAWIYPMQTGDGIADVWNTKFNATGGTQFTEQLKRGYEVSVSATTTTGETADTIIEITNNVNASVAGWIYEYGTGRALDPPRVLGKNPGLRPWLHVQTRDLANGTHNATVYDAWTHDQLAQRVITVDGAAKSPSFELDRYPSIDQSSVASGTVARDIESPAWSSNTTQLLETGFNVRLTVFGASSSTNLTVTEQLPSGYRLNQSYANASAPVGVSYDGSGTVTATYDNETNTLTLEIAGEVSDIRYRVVPVDGGRRVATFTGHAGTQTIAGETYLGDTPLSGTITLPNGTPADEAAVVARPVTSSGRLVHGRTDDNGRYALPVALGTQYALGYYESADRFTKDGHDGSPDIFSIGTVNVSAPTTRNATLPAAHNVSFQIVDSDGKPVGSDVVHVSLSHHVAGFTSPTPARVNGIPVNDNGMVMPENGSSTWDLVGNVTLTVVPDTGTGRFTKVVTQNVTVTSDRSVTVTVPEEQQPPAAVVNASDTSVLTGNSVVVTSRNSTDNSEIASRNWTVTGPDGSERTFTGSSVTFTPNASGTWTVAVTVTDVAGNTDTASTTVTVNDPANVTIDYAFGANGSDGELTTAELVTVTATATNVGDLKTNETVALIVDGQRVDTRTVTLAGGESTTVTFTTSLAQGTHDVGIRGAGTTELEVFEPANLSVAYDVSATEIFLSDVLDVTATVTNDGGVPGTTQVALRVANTTVTTTNVTVAAGETATVDFTHRFATVGTYNVTVSSLGATPVAVSQATNPAASVRITSPTQGATLDDTLTVEYALSNTTTGIQGVVYQVGNRSRQPVADGLNASTFTVTNLSDGTQTVTVWLRDNAGNLIAKSERTFTVDTTAPSASVNASDTVVGPEQSVAVNVTVDDQTLNTTTATLANSNGTVVETFALTDRAADGQATVTIDASANGSRLASGTYTLQVTATDEAGESATATDTVTVDTSTPTASSLEISGTTTTDGTDYLNASGALTVTGTVTDSGDASVSQATVVLVSQAATYNATKTIPLADDGAFNATLALDGAPAGEYKVVVRASDTAGNALVKPGVATFTYDDVAPTLGVSISAVNATDGRVRVTADEPLATTPNVTVNGPTNTSNLELTQVEPGVYSTTFEFGQFGNDGSYTATATGVDLAGQADTATSNTSVQTNVRVENGSALIETGGGTFINLSLSTTSVSDAVASLSTSDTPLAELSVGLNGSQFIEGELGKQLSSNLTSAKIGIPRSDVSLPSGVNASEITIRRYNETTGQWENVGDTTLATRTINGTQREYFIVNVTHFSTYGAMASDTEAPTIDSVSLSNTGLKTGTTYQYSTDTVTTTVEYSDDVAGINASAVEVYFNGELVGQQPGVTADVTSDDVVVTATNLVGSGLNNVTVIATDETGKTTQNITTFTVTQDTTNPVLKTDSVTNSTTLDYGTTTKTLTFTYTDDLSGVNASSVTVSVNGTQLSDAETVVDDDYVTFDVTGLTPGATKTVSVSVTDEAGNTETNTKTFSVAADTTGPTLQDTTYSVSGTSTTPPFNSTTATVTATLDITDSESGVDANALTLQFGKQGSTLETVDSQALLTDSKIEYTATGLEDNTTYVLNATLTDNNGNTRHVEKTFNVSADTNAPAVTETTFTPSASTSSPTFDLDTNNVTIEMALKDASGVNTSAVVVKFGEHGTPLHTVTETATVTGDIVRYNNDSLEAGTTYELSATLVDTNGNAQTVTRTFTVAADQAAPVVTDTTYSPTAATTSPTFKAGTDSVSIHLSVTDETSLNTSAVRVQFGEQGALKPVSATVSSDTVHYDATGLTNGTTYKVQVTLVDSTGNEDTITRRFSVASPTTDDESGRDETDPTPPDNTDDTDATPPSNTDPTSPNNTDDTPTTTTPPTTSDDKTTTPPTTTDDTPTTTTPPTTSDDKTTTPPTTSDDTTTAPPATTETTKGGGSGSRVPGFTGMTAIAALLASAVLVLRTRD